MQENKKRLFKGWQCRIRLLRMGCLQVRTLDRRARLGLTAGRQSMQTSVGSCYQRSRIGSDTRRFQWSRFGRGRWSSRRTYLTARVRNILFGFFQLHFVQMQYINDPQFLNGAKKGTTNGEVGAKKPNVQLRASESVWRENFGKHELLHGAHSRNTKLAEQFTVDYSEKSVF